MNKNKKRWIIVITAIVLLLIIIVISVGALVKVFKRKAAMKAYRQFLSQDQLEWSTDSEISAESLSFGLEDIEQDGIPELILYNMDASQADGWNRIYVFNKGEVESLGQFVNITFYPKTKCFADLYNDRGYEKAGFFTIRNGEKKTLASYECSDSRPDGEEYVVKELNGWDHYYYNMKVDGEKSSYENCMKRIKLLSHDEAVVNYYTNTEENRIAHLK